ncbi:metallophosphoesterase [Paenibacillus sp. UMB4589-SE434]|uniref:metallophosphoesterase family protein n=1 Tax=Paenibacillus sp. UMB4589-SE434 TaxID=3046314 RepID=UPI00254E5C6C|nr:metallophosphoesterase [Paenibacillus sp. UMB4589-SE434]MDK8180321.1 metallophosphoesterase [Paenibacillus sp. UMB4589-SE434]
MKKRAGGQAPLKVICMAKEPIEQLAYTTASSGSQGVSYDYLPIYLGEILGLPAELDALIVTSDLQGIAGHGTREEHSSKLVGEELPEIVALLLESILPQYDPERVGVLLCGDLYGDPLKRGASGDPLPVWKAFHQHFGTVLGVAGNHDLFTAEGAGWLKAASGVNLFAEPKIATYCGMTVAGLGGVIGRADKPNRMPEEKYLDTLQKLLHRGPQVLMLHQGPDFPSQGLPGHAGMRRMVEAFPPMLICCGHVHWDQAIAELDNGTQVINADGRVLVFTAAEMD